MEKSYSTKELFGPDVDIIQYCRDYANILDDMNDKYDLIIQDQQGLLKSDQHFLRSKYSDPFLAFMNKCESLREVINQFKHILASTEQISEIKRRAQLREYLLDKTSNEPTDAKIILDGLVGFYSSASRGYSLKMKDYFDSHAFCYGALTLIPGNKEACKYIVKPERVDKVLGGDSWQGQPKLRNDRSRVGLCPACLLSLLRMRIDSHQAYLEKIRNSLANNKNSPYAKAAADKEKQLTQELTALQNDLEKVIVAKSAFERVEEEETQPDTRLISFQKGESDEEDDALLSLLVEESMLDPEIGSNEDKQKMMTHILSDREESDSNSEQKETESTRVTRAASKQKETAALNEKNDYTKSTSAKQKNGSQNRPLTSPKLKLNNNKEPVVAPNTRSRTTALQNEQNDEALSMERAQSQKRKRKDNESNTPNKRRKQQPADHDLNVSTNKEQKVLTILIDDTTCSYPLTTSQVFLFNALAVLVSPEFTKNAELRAMYHDSMSQVDLATLSHLKDMLSLAYRKKCESIGLK